MIGILRNWPKNKTYSVFEPDQRELAHQPLPTVIDSLIKQVQNRHQVSQLFSLQTYMIGKYPNPAALPYFHPI